jgi:triacylglycerol lipase
MNAPFDAFNPNTTRWVPANALALAHAAKLAYSSPAIVKRKVTSWGFAPSKFKFITSAHRKPLLDTQAFVAGTDEMIVVSFRGTQPDNADDWLTDLDALLRPFSPGRVHKGFYDALDIVWEQVFATVEKFQDNAQSLWITGHSLGAALACLATARTVFERRHPVGGLYTFGQPRTGDTEFARSFDGEFGNKTFRFVNDQDIVTRVPPRALFYEHVGRLLFFDGQGRLQNDDHFWNRFLMEVEVDFESMVKPKEVITDHSMDHYIGNLAKNLNTPLTW